jgi:hypothetical protein
MSCPFEVSALFAMVGSLMQTDLERRAYGAGLLIRLAPSRGACNERFYYVGS